jgi:hypothetical protein
VTGSRAKGGDAKAKPLDAWTDLNDRQRGTLTVIYQLDQENEQGRRADAARGAYDKTPAAQWRLLDFAHDPSLRELLGDTAMQVRLERRGWDNQGNGSTMAALVRRGLVVHGEARPTPFGVMLRVKLTNHGRSAARAGLSRQPGGRPKNVLPARTWEVLGILWAADQRGEPLRWGFSRTIEFSLIARHTPPLAESVPGGYALTDRGREFYREAYPVHAAAHPDVHVPHPDGPAADPWPAQADQVLLAHRDRCRALAEEWRLAVEARQSAEKEAAAAASPSDALPPAAAKLAVARRELWTQTAGRRAELAAEQADELARMTERAARRYAVAALAVFGAAVAGASPLEGLEPPGDEDDWDEPRLVPPAQTGVHAIDDQARRLHADAAGTPVKRRGPAPRRRYAPRHEARPEAPGDKLVALAECLRLNTDGGGLLLRMHPDRARTTREEA